MANSAEQDGLHVPVNPTTIAPVKAFVKKGSDFVAKVYMPT